MIEISFAISIAISTLGFGIIGGILLHYWVDHRPLLTKYHELIHTLTHMKKQGFVPMYEIEQPEVIDVSKDIRE